MRNDIKFTVVDGVKCYSPDVACEYTDYPDDGFDLTESIVDTSFWVASRNRLFKEIITRSLKPIKKTKFLEIGCGTGNFISKISGIEELVITGSEIYLKGLVYAKKRLPNVEFVQFDVTQGIIDERFDMIAAFDVIEHIDNDLLALSNMADMLNKGGKLIISVPQHKFLWSNLDLIVRHKRRYSKSELIQKLLVNNFEISYATSFIFTLFPLMILSRLFDGVSNNKLTHNKQELEKRVRFSGSLNKILDFFMHIDEFLIRLGFSLPFGGTLVVVAKKK